MNENVADRPLPNVCNVSFMNLVNEETGLDRSMSDTCVTSQFQSSI